MMAAVLPAGAPAGSPAGAASALRQINDVFDHRHPDDMACIRQALQGGLSGTAPMVERYETLLAAQYGMPHALTVSSGTAAVAVAMSAFDWQGGDEVILAPTGPICTVLPLMKHGLRPVFCDVVPDSFGLDLQQVEQALSHRTRAIIEVPMWGYPTRADLLRALAQKHGIPFILDLAHCHATRLDGRWLANHAQVACFSTHEGKFMSTGEGGFVLSSEAGLDLRMRRHARFGNLDGIHVGQNYKLGGLQAALGVARVAAIEPHLAQRLRNRDTILAGLCNPHVRELPVVEGGVVNGYALMLQTVASDGRALVDYLVKRGIPSDIDKYDNRPLYDYPLLAAYRRDCPNAARLLRSLTTIPLHPALDQADLDYIIATINAYVPT